MKRASGLFPILISDANLEKAINEVNRTHRWGRHHRPRRCVQWVERTKPDRIVELREIIINGFDPSPGRKRVIYDKSGNKFREIVEPKLWPDQYVHHALIQVIQGPIMRGMDYWCCGSVPDRGTKHGVNGIKKWMKNDPTGTRYCAELDVHQFYKSLKPGVVWSRMTCIIKDPDVLDLIARTLRYGVPIGNYCSQWYANAVLQPLDHLIREELKIRHYVRYMDNFTLFASSKRKLHAAVRVIDQWLRERDMRIKDNWQVFPTDCRMPNAMGYRYARGHTLPRKRTVLRFKRACKRVLRRIRQGRQPTYSQACAILSRIGWLSHCDARQLMSKWLSVLGVKRLKDIVRSRSNNMILIGRT